jgi:hypothetical protein
MIITEPLTGATVRMFLMLDQRPVDRKLFSTAMAHAPSVGDYATLVLDAEGISHPIMRITRVEVVATEDLTLEQAKDACWDSLEEWKQHLATVAPNDTSHALVWFEWTLFDMSGIVKDGVFCGRANP